MLAADTPLPFKTGDGPRTGPTVVPVALVFSSGLVVVLKGIPVVQVKRLGRRFPTAEVPPETVHRKVLVSVHPPSAGSVDLGPRP